ncbi:phasin family protein [Bifidobacterium aquikefiricola]|uniref:Cytosolic protein n=1 Tax=Bifidobacterium aquikefiricola TaxID=3059038 RepID=A0AB39U7V5_9BIFI
MATQDLGDGLRKVLLAGVGALATGIEKSQAIVDDLARKGEITVEQGKQLNSELKRTFKDNTGSQARSAAEDRVDAKKASEAAPFASTEEGPTGDPDDLGNNVNAL